MREGMKGTWFTTRTWDRTGLKCTRHHPPVWCFADSRSKSCHIAWPPGWAKQDVESYGLTYKDHTSSGGHAALNLSMLHHASKRTLHLEHVLCFPRPAINLKNRPECLCHEYEQPQSKQRPSECCFMLLVIFGTSKLQIVLCTSMYLFMLTQERFCESFLFRVFVQGYLYHTATSMQDSS